MSDAPNTPAPPASGELSLSEAASRIEGLLGPASADTPKPEEETAGADEPQTAAPEDDAATQPAETEGAAEDQPSDGETDDGETPADQKPPQTFEVALPDGTKAKVTADELTKGYLRREDYTRKTQDLSANVKAFEAQVQQHGQLVKQRLDTLVAELDKLVVDESKIDWDKFYADNPTEAARWDRHYRDLKAKRDAHKADSERIAAANREQAERVQAELLQREDGLLKQKLPVFADAAKADGAKAELRSFLAKSGFTPEEMQGLSDHRLAIVAWKAAQYDKARAAKPPIAKRVVGLPKVQKPGAAIDGDSVSRQKVTALDMKLRKSGRVEDAAALLLARMN